MSVPKRKTVPRRKSRNKSDCGNLKWIHHARGRGKETKKIERGMRRFYPESEEEDDDESIDLQCDFSLPLLCLFSFIASYQNPQFRAQRSTISMTKRRWRCACWWWWTTPFKILLRNHFRIFLSNWSSKIIGSKYFVIVMGNGSVDHFVGKLIVTCEHLCKNKICRKLRPIRSKICSKFMQYKLLKNARLINTFLVVVLP